MARIRNKIGKQDRRIVGNFRRTWSSVNLSKLIPWTLPRHVLVIRGRGRGRGRRSNLFCCFNYIINRYPFCICFFPWGSKVPVKHLFYRFRDIFFLPVLIHFLARIFNIFQRNGSPNFSRTLLRLFRSDFLFSCILKWEDFHEQISGFQG